MTVFVESFSLSKMRLEGLSVSGSGIIPTAHESHSFTDMNTGSKTKACLYPLSYPANSRSIYLLELVYHMMETGGMSIIPI